MAEKGWSRTIRATYAPQLGFEDRWGHRAPSFSPTGGAKIPRFPRRGKNHSRAASAPSILPLRGRGGINSPVHLSVRGGVLNIRPGSDAQRDFEGVVQ